MPQNQKPSSPLRYRRVFHRPCQLSHHFSSYRRLKNYNWSKFHFAFSSPNISRYRSQFRNHKKTTVGLVNLMLHPIPLRQFLPCTDRDFDAVLKRRQRAAEQIVPGAFGLCRWVRTWRGGDYSGKEALRTLCPQGLHSSTVVVFESNTQLDRQTLKRTGDYRSAIFWYGLASSIALISVKGSF